MKSFVFIFVLLLIPFSVVAEVYQYRDSTGRTHFVDSLEKVPEQFRSQVRSSESLPKITKMEHVIAPVRESASGGKQVTVYVTEWCPYCRNVQAFLKRKNVTFKTYDIERDAAGRRKYQQLGGGGVPIVTIGNEVVRGFDPNRISAILGK